MQMHIKSRYEYTRIGVRAPVQLTKGDYELTVSAKASKSETFFYGYMTQIQALGLVELYI